MAIRLALQDKMYFPERPSHKISQLFLDGAVTTHGGFEQEKVLLSSLVLHGVI